MLIDLDVLASEDGINFVDPVGGEPQKQKPFYYRIGLTSSIPVSSE